MLVTGLETLLEKVANATPAMNLLKPKKSFASRLLPYAAAATAGALYTQAHANKVDNKYKNMVSVPTEGSY